ncbi:MAG: SpoIIE family protein phosphatase [Bacteroidota bacterium]
MVEILLVDDNEDDQIYFSHLIKKTFPEEKFNIRLAGNGIEAIECFQNCLPDLVFLDQNLSDQNGLEVLEQLKQISPVPIYIFLTGFDNPEAASLAMSKGAIDYLDKNSLSTQGLRHAVRNARLIRRQMDLIEAQRAQLERENQKLNEKERELAKSLSRIEADNARILRELEEARNIQLNMLPKEFPVLNSFRLLPYMETAAEVGGDYYDWVIRNHDEMICTIGDVTGHGLRAGIVVATVKSFFQSLGESMDGKSIINRISEGIKGLGIRNTYMGLAVMEIKNQHITISAAGMPPILYYSSLINKWNVIRLPGMYLGTNFNLPISSVNFKTTKGDIILTFTDGLTEMFNREKESLGLNRILSAVKEIPTPSTKNVMDTVKNLVKDWRDGGKNHDDWTILIFEAHA